MAAEIELDHWAGYSKNSAYFLMGPGLDTLAKRILTAARQKLHTGRLASGAAASFTVSELVRDVASTLPTFSDYLAARRIDPRREHVVFDQWDRASRDFTHPECETARALILRWLTWSDPVSRYCAEMRNKASHPSPTKSYSTLLENNKPNRGPALEDARSEAHGRCLIKVALLI